MRSSLFTDLKLDGQPFLWSYRRIKESDFKGYYHWHHGFEFLYVHRGYGKVIVNQHTYDIQAGMLFCFRPLQLHKVYVEANESQPYERSVFHFDEAVMETYIGAFSTLKDVLHKLSEGLIDEQGFDLSPYKVDVDEASSSLQIGIQSSSSTISKEEQGAIYLLRLLTMIQRRGVNNQHQVYAHVLKHSERVMAWIELHYNEPFELERLAAEIHMSKAYLSRLFRQETGSSITGYLTARRIRQACILLQTSDQTVERIGEQIGLTNVSYFIQLFKKVMGISPHQYRLKL